MSLSVAEGDLSDLEVDETASEIIVDYDSFPSSLGNNANEFVVHLDAKPVGSEFSGLATTPTRQYEDSGLYNCVAAKPDEPIIATEGSNVEISLLNTDTFLEVEEGPVADVSPSDNIINFMEFSSSYLFVDVTDKIRVYETDGWSEISASPLTVGTELASLAVSDGNYVAVSTIENEVYVYNTSDWSQVSGSPFSNPDAGSASAIYSTAFNSDGSLFAFGSQAGNVRVYDTSDWSEISESPVTLPAGSNGSGNSLDFSPDDSVLAVGSEDNLVFYQTSDWTQQSGSPISINGSAADVQFGPNGSRIAHSAGLSGVKVRNVSDGSIILDTGSYTYATFRWTSQYLAMASGSELRFYADGNQFEPLVSGYVDSGAVPSDTITEPVSSVLATNRGEFTPDDEPTDYSLAKHGQISDNFQALEPSGSTEKVTDVEFRVTAESRSAGVRSTDTITITITISEDLSGSSAVGGSISLDGS